MLAPPYDEDAQITYEEVYGLTDYDKIPKPEQLDANTTDVPFVINVVNPNKGVLTSKVCLLCNDSRCVNCPLPSSENFTLR